MTLQFCFFIIIPRQYFTLIVCVCQAKIKKTFCNFSNALDIFVFLRYNLYKRKVKFYDFKTPEYRMDHVRPTFGALLWVLWPPNRQNAAHRRIGPKLHIVRAGVHHLPDVHTCPFCHAHGKIRQQNGHDLHSASFAPRKDGGAYA